MQDRWMLQDVFNEIDGLGKIETVRNSFIQSDPKLTDLSDLLFTIFTDSEFVLYLPYAGQG